MRSKNHHLLLRGHLWHLKLRIPVDLYDQYSERLSKFIEEPLKTTDVVAARALRDQRLAKYQRLWTEMRIKKGRDVVGNQVQASARSTDPDEIDYLISVYGDRIDKLAEAKALANGADDLDDARDAVTEAGEGAHLWREIQVLRGSLTPLAPLGEVWLASKSQRSPKTLSDYRLALRLLTERFPYRENLSWDKARAFLDELLVTKAKDTVQKYIIAYRGVWENNGWVAEQSMWSVKNKDSGIKSLRVRSFSDEQYIRLMTAMREQGKRKLWLATQIAAYSGASLSGVCGLELRGFDTDQPSLYLPETKKEWRSRIVPCHPKIVGIALEWNGSRLAGQSVTNQFSLLKAGLGFGPEHRFHSFRHSVANRLENARALDREIKRLLGHLIGNITFDTYSAEGLGYPQLVEVVGKISWPHVEPVW